MSDFGNPKEVDKLWSVGVKLKILEKLYSNKAFCGCVPFTAKTKRTN